MKGSLSLVLLLVGLAGKLASGTLHKDHGSAHETEDGKHNEAHDAEAMLGSQASANEFSKMKPERAKETLTDIFNKMDTTKDKFISKEELTQWIMKSFITMDYEEAENTMADKDENNDEKVTWEEYANKMGENKKDTKDEYFVTMMEKEKKKFAVADVDRDGALTLKEYAAFMYPYDFEHMHEIELEVTMASIDKDKDGKVNLKEFLNEGHEKDVELNKELFDKFDTNKDNLLDHEEIRPWIIPSNIEEATKEADHLISLTDMNGDKKLSLKEIIGKASVWGASTATTYKGSHDEL